jgi:hypothetical protein
MRIKDGSYQNCWMAADTPDAPAPPVTLPLPPGPPLLVTAAVVNPVYVDWLALIEVPLTIGAVLPVQAMPIELPPAPPPPPLPSAPLPPPPPEQSGEDCA